MSTFKKGLVLAILFPMMLFADLNEGMRKTLLSELELIRTIFSVQYAPKKWKSVYKDWDLEQEIAIAKNEIATMRPLTIKGYHRTVRKFFQSFADYHVGATFFSTEQAVLPFLIRSAEKRFFIVEIDRSLLPQNVFSAEVGDEILFFGGKPIAEAVRELKKSDFDQNTPGTDQALAELALTVRDGWEGLIIPKGKIEVVVRKKAGNIQSYLLNWLYIPELISEPGSQKKDPFFVKNKSLAKKDIAKSFFEKKMIYSKYENSNKLPITKDASYLPGAHKSYVPLLGNPIWKSGEDDPFYSYIFLHAGKRIGYVRIPHYYGEESDVEEFRKTILIMESMTDCLVIDQVNNPGGSLFYLYALASYLTDYPLVTPKHQIALTQDEIMSAASVNMMLDGVDNTVAAQEVLGNTISGYLVTIKVAKKLQEFAKNIISEWENGNLLTHPTFLFGLDEIEPSPYGGYTKPILLLINDLCFSGGDFFPAIMKENHRAKILGTRTAGAGGYVQNVNFFNLGGIKKFTLTSSFAQTKDLMPIENIGVTPDIDVKLTVKDLQNKGVDLKHSILKNIDSIISHR